mmetsp:Transcript_152099/g.283396  ORF Transcript_152099/g.283396 Transcript_152099/m.283396 type:complete len:203 (+) Transcript_152099:543-1151(+)
MSSLKAGSMNPELHSLTLALRVDSHISSLFGILRSCGGPLPVLFACSQSYLGQIVGSTAQQRVRRRLHPRALISWKLLPEVKGPLHCISQHLLCHGLLKECLCFFACAAPDQKHAILYQSIASARLGVERCLVGYLSSLEIFLLLEQDVAHPLVVPPCMSRVVFQRLTQDDHSFVDLIPSQVPLNQAQLSLQICSIILYCGS